MSTSYKKENLMQEIYQKVLDKINENGGVVKREELMALGIDYRRILYMVEHQQLVRIKNGYYTDRMDRMSQEELVAGLFPDAKLCMESALYLYGYLDEQPKVWHLAVDKNTSKSRFHMEYPMVIPYYTEPEVLTLGATEIEWNGAHFGIYDKERTICDCLKYEDKMEREDFKQALHAYIKDPDKDVSALLEYAHQRRVLNKVQNLIGVWL